MNSLSENRRLRQAALYFQGGRCSRRAESAGLAARVVRRSHLEGRLSRRWAGIRFASDPASLYSVNCLSRTATRLIFKAISTSHEVLW